MIYFTVNLKVSQYQRRHENTITSIKGHISTDLTRASGASVIYSGLPVKRVILGSRNIRLI